MVSYASNNINDFSCAESQVRKWNKEDGREHLKSEITHNEPSGPDARDKILKYERERAGDLKKKQQLCDKNRHQKP